MISVPLSRYLLFFGVAAAAAAWDLATKSWVFTWLGPPGNGRNIYWIFPDVLALATHYNEGALFGMGQGLNFVFAALSVVAACGIVYWLFVRKAARDARLTLALALITAGILGNLYDRLGLHGFVNAQGDPVYAVRDFIHWVYLFEWPIFNFADSFLVTGASLLFLLSFLTPSSRHEADPEGSDSL